MLIGSRKQHSVICRLELRLLGIDQALARVSAILGAIELRLPGETPQLAAVDLSLAMGDVHGPLEFLRFQTLTLAVQRLLVVIDVVLADLGHELLAVGNALIHTDHSLLLIEARLAA